MVAFKPSPSCLFCASFNVSCMFKIFRVLFVLKKANNKKKGFGFNMTCKGAGFTVEHCKSFSSPIEVKVFTLSSLQTNGLIVFVPCDWLEKKFKEKIKMVLLDPDAHLCNKKHKGSCFELKRAKRHSPVLINNAGNILALRWVTEGHHHVQEKPECKMLVRGLSNQDVGIETVGKDPAFSRDSPFISSIHSVRTHFTSLRGGNYFLSVRLNHWTLNSWW